MRSQHNSSRCPSVDFEEASSIGTRRSLGVWGALQLVVFRTAAGGAGRLIAGSATSEGLIDVGKSLRVAARSRGLTMRLFGAPHAAGPMNIIRASIIRQAHTWLGAWPDRPAAQRHPRGSGQFDPADHDFVAATGSPASRLLTPSPERTHCRSSTSPSSGRAAFGPPYDANCSLTSPRPSVRDSLGQSRCRLGESR